MSLLAADVRVLLLLVRALLRSALFRASVTTLQRLSPRFSIILCSRLGMATAGWQAVRPAARQQVRARKRALHASGH